MLAILFAARKHINNQQLSNDVPRSMCRRTSFLQQCMYRRIFVVSVGTAVLFASKTYWRKATTFLIMWRTLLNSSKSLTPCSTDTQCSDPFLSMLNVDILRYNAWSAFSRLVEG